MSKDAYYLGSTDVKPAKVTVIQYADKGKRVEIIRGENIGDREIFAGFWINTEELEIK